MRDDFSSMCLLPEIPLERRAGGLEIESDGERLGDVATRRR